MKRICVNCGSSPGFDGCHMAMVERLGRVLVKQGLELVYGGAHVGLMGQVAGAVMEAGGVVIGVIPGSFADRVAHKGLTQLHIVGSMHERKTMMFNLSDAFIALPGGFGTLEELTELLTWAQLGLHAKPVGLINVDGYYDQFLAFLDSAVAKGFIKQAHRKALLVSGSPEDLLEQFKVYRAPHEEKWIGRKPIP
ncbi:MAG: TIGR00730 family Rossman fold protein [Planctomycetota bacterium]